MTLVSISEFKFRSAKPERISVGILYRCYNSETSTTFLSSSIATALDPRTDSIKSGEWRHDDAEHSFWLLSLPLTEFGRDSQLHHFIPHFVICFRIFVQLDEEIGQTVKLPGRNRRPISGDGICPSARWERETEHVVWLSQVTKKTV